MRQPLIIVKARLQLKTTADGGRATPFLSGYRPNHVFEVTNPLRTFIGDILLDDRELLYPGESADVTVRFLPVPEILRFMKAGRHWYINEANKNIGQAEIMAVTIPA